MSPPGHGPGAPPRRWTTRWLPRSLRARSALSSALVCAVLVVGVGLGAVHLLDARLDTRVADALLDRLSQARLAVSDGPLDGLPGPTRSDGVLPSAEQLTQVVDGTGALVLSLPAGIPALLDADQVAAARTGVVRTQVVGPGLQSTSVAAGPATTRDGDDVVVVVGASLTPNRTAVQEARALVLLAAVPAALLGGLGAWLLAGAALRPVERVRRAAEQVRVRDEDVGLWIPPTGDELERLTRTLDALVRQLHAALRERQDQLADVAHELRTPLGALGVELELLEARARDDGWAGLPGLLATRASMDRLAALVERLLLLGAGDRGADLLHLTVCEPADLVAEAAERGTRAAAGTGVRVVAREPDGDLPALVCDRTRVGQILDNLVANAVAVLRDGGCVELGVTSVGGDVVLEVADDGPGFGDVPPEEVFTRFRRGGSSRRPGDGGMGLGLAIVRELARAHDGDAVAGRAATGG
ncbi:HAMP domain-containing sensor histidine kinase, partial [Klenkia sp. PcliD-1-E]|uniref:sensor histidine kinase n=1 Tax=Klenkia sp. PcliD-1-E TaxID=2954492 RepID=UPI00209820B3